MVDTIDSKSIAGDCVRVQVSSPVNPRSCKSNSFFLFKRLELRNRRRASEVSHHGRWRQAVKAFPKEANRKFADNGASLFAGKSKELRKQLFFLFKRLELRNRRRASEVSHHGRWRQAVKAFPKEANRKFADNGASLFAGKSKELQKQLLIFFQKVYSNISSRW